MNRIEELKAKYGDLILQSEAIQNTLLEVKRQIIEEMNRPSLPGKVEKPLNKS